MLTGASSMIFWCRRCTEQSRPNKLIAWPYWSASTCTSRCRAALASFITNTGDPGTSPTAAWYSCTNMSGDTHFRMPLPPPPSDALIITGKPMRCAIASPSSAECTHARSYASSGTLTYPSVLCIVSVMPVPDHGRHGTFACCATIVDEILSPSARIAVPGGPRNRIRGSRRASISGSRGFSDACPQPAHTACTPARSAISTINSTFA